MRHQLNPHLLSLAPLKHGLTLCLILWLIISGLNFAPQISAQSIETGQLEQAQAYDPGFLEDQQRSLDPALWDGTSAPRATALIKISSHHMDQSLAQNYLRQVLLSAGTPPISQTAEEAQAYNQARINAIIALGDFNTAQTLSLRASSSMNIAQEQSRLALWTGQYDIACQTAQDPTQVKAQDRALPFWARLRSFCHILNENIAAAELTAKLLKESGYKDPLFFHLIDYHAQTNPDPPDLSDTPMDDPLYIALIKRADLSIPDAYLSPAIARNIATDDTQSFENRLNALYYLGWALSDEAIRQIINDMIKELDTKTHDTSANHINPDNQDDIIDDLLGDRTINGTLGLYQSVYNPTSQTRPHQAQLIAEILSRADRQGGFSRFAQLLAPLITPLPAKDQFNADPEIFTRAAIERADIRTLQAFYPLFEETPQRQARLALATDALGYGFLNQPLGRDIDNRLQSDEEHQKALRDAYVGLALGGTLSDAAFKALIEDAHFSPDEYFSSQYTLPIRAAAKARSRAETLLIAVKMLSQDPLNHEDLYTVIDALNRAGLPQFAGQLAAQYFWMGL